MSVSRTPSRRHQTEHHRQHGQVLVLSALLLTAILAMGGLLIDGGLAWTNRRQAQNAADTGAYAGANAVAKGMDVKAAAQAIAATNGFPADLVDCSGATQVGRGVVVNRPPTSGPNQGNNRFVEVVTTRALHTVLARVIGQGCWLVSARAVAGIRAELGCAVIGLRNDPTLPSVHFEADADVVNGCIISNGQVDTTNPNDPPTKWADVNGNIYAVAGPAPNVNYVGPGGPYGPVIPSPVIVDPYADPSLKPPIPTNPGSSQVVGGITIWSPGTFPGITITGGTHRFTSGVYYLTADFNITGGYAYNDPAGDGPVVFVMAGGTVRTNSGGAINFTSGPRFNNFVIYSPTGDIFLYGSGYTQPYQLKGIVYAPKGAIEVGGPPGVKHLTGQVVGATVTLEEWSTVATGDSQFGAPFSSVYLAE